MKINNVTLAIVFVALILAAFLPQWFSAQNKDHTEIIDTTVTAGLMAMILTVTKLLTGRKE